MKSVFLDYATVSQGDLNPSSLIEAAPQLQIRELTSQADVAETISGHAVVLLNKLQLTRDIILGAQDLRLVALAATGTNNIDLQAAKEKGVAVCNIRDYCSASVAQHVLGVLLMLTHKLREYSRDAIDGTWAQSQHFTILDHPIRE
ncbi:MAG: glycerate dehydrogenase, partial [Burkholderiaceae bacterium]